MKQIDAYILLKFGQNISPELTPKNLKNILNEEFNIIQTAEEWQHMFIKNPPKTRYLVHALREKGFAPKTISDWLDIHPANVSYHLSKPLTSYYSNPSLEIAKKYSNV